jgi:uncharacterized protein YdhG (YjbR/CyaY superfamily)
MISTTLNPKVDAYVAKAQPFAQPIVEHLRQLIHKACPEIDETIKWSRPFFEYRGAILCNMSAFKEHCSFGFWGEEMSAVLREAKVLREHGMGSLSFRHRNRHCLAGAAFGDPDRVARGLDCGWCLESFLDYRDAGLIAIDSNNGNLAAAILGNE